MLNCTQYRDNNNTKGNDRKTQKKKGKQFPHSKTLVQEPQGNKENRYSDSDSNKMKITMPKNPMKPRRII
jgi:hypothetical protein